jgi:hypothetical protein
MALRLTPRSPRGSGFLVPVTKGSLRFRPQSRNRISTRLTPASRCQDHAASPYEAAPHALRHDRVHRSPRNASWRSRNALRSERGMGDNIGRFLVFENRFIFGLDTFLKNSRCFARRVAAATVRTAFRSDPRGEGSKGVNSTLKSGHQLCRLQCPLRATSRHIR